MCGISGELRFDGAPAAREALEAMSAAMVHRGPDGAGMLLDGELGVAARRLAIVDVAHGDQPIGNEDGTVHAVLNGELYDTPPLGSGHRLATRCDTELLVHLYEERGLAFVSELRGMFAFAIWDARRRRLVLARDRFGIKPLVYAQDGDRLAFASELKALLTRADVPRDLDLDALEQYLAFNAVMSPRTMLSAVRKLPPGHLLIAEHGAVRVERYASSSSFLTEQLLSSGAPPTNNDVSQAVSASVAAHLSGDVPVGLLLSGGLDSGLLCAFASRYGPLKTFTAGFDHPSFDELAGARSIARRYGTEHHEVRVTAQDAEELLPVIARDFDEPRGDATALPYWLVARLASGSVKAVLAGEGADELFGGYQTYAADRLGPRAARAAALVAPLVARAVPSSSGRLPLDFRLRRLARGAGLGPLERHHAWKELFSADERARLLTERGGADPLDAYRAIHAETAGAEPLARLQHLDLATFVADDLLLQADRAGMAHGVEIRVPYLDPAVARLAFSLRADARVRGLQTKRALRAAAEGHLPPEIVRGPKRGFVAPAAAWLRGPLEPFAREALSPAVLRRQGLVRPEAVTALLDRHASRREDLSRPLWALLALTLWHDVVLTAPPAPSVRQPVLRGF